MLRLILFPLYISPVQVFARLHILEIMIYADDTQLYIFLSHDQLKVKSAKIATPSLSMLIDGHDIKQADSVRNLGVILDCNLSM